MSWIPSDQKERHQLWYGLRDPETGAPLYFDPEEIAQRGLDDLHFFVTIILGYTDLTLPDRFHGEFCRFLEATRWTPELGEMKVRSSIRMSRALFKTTIVSIGETLQLIAADPNSTHVICTATPDLAGQISKRIRDTITDNATLKQCYPYLKRGDQWKTDRFIVRRSGTNVIEPSVACLGLKKGAAGLHPSRIIFDDLCNEENTKSEAGRKEATDFYQATQPLLLWGSERDNGTPFHEEDHHAWVDKKLVSTGQMKQYKRPMWDGDYCEENLIFPEKYSFAWLEEQRHAMGDRQFYAQYGLDIHSAADQKITPDNMKWFDHEVTPEEAKLKYVTVLGFDPATGDGADECAIVVVGVTYDRKEYAMLEELHGRWEASESVAKFRQTVRKWGVRYARMETISGFKTLGQVIVKDMQDAGEYIIFTPVVHASDKVSRMEASLQPLYANRAVWHQPSMKGGKFESQLQWAWRKDDRNDIIDAAGRGVDEAQQRYMQAPGGVKPTVKKADIASGYRTVPGTGAEMFAQAARTSRAKQDRRAPLRLL
jgi:predicted phage terminase large subunit-like protein